jgi:hypothetical protein
MPSLALWVSGNEAFIFEIELDLLPWLTKLQWPGLATAILFDAARLAQDLEDSWSVSAADAAQPL